MLSSTMVSVVTPWSSRYWQLRHNLEPTGCAANKSGQESSDIGQEVNGQTIMSRDPVSLHDMLKQRIPRFQKQDVVEGEVPLGYKALERTSMLATRRNTVVGLNNTSHTGLKTDSPATSRLRKSVSVNVSASQPNHREVFSSSAFTSLDPLPTPSSTNSNDLSGYRRSQISGHGDSFSSSKPTTSSRLLSMRKINSDGRNSIAGSAQVETYPSHSTNSLPSPKSRTLQRSKSNTSLSFPNDSYFEKCSSPSLTLFPSNREIDTSGSHISRASSREMENSKLNYSPASPREIETSRLHSLPASPRQMEISRPQISPASPRQMGNSRLLYPPASPRQIEISRPFYSPTSPRETEIPTPNISPASPKEMQTSRSHISPTSPGIRVFPNTRLERLHSTDRQNRTLDSIRESQVPPSASNGSCLDFLQSQTLPRKIRLNSEVENVANKNNPQSTTKPGNVSSTVTSQQTTSNNYSHRNIQNMSFHSEPQRSNTIDSSVTSFSPNTPGTPTTPRSNNSTLSGSPKSLYRSHSLINVNLDNQSTLLTRQSSADRTSPFPPSQPLLSSRSLKERTFTSSLEFSPKEIPQNHEWRRPPNSNSGTKSRSQSQLLQSTTPMTSHLSASRPYRSIGAPDIFSLLRPASPTPAVVSQLTPGPRAPRSPLQRTDSRATHLASNTDKKPGGGDQARVPSRTPTFTLDPSTKESGSSGPQQRPLDRHPACSSSPLSLPPDFGSNFKPRLSHSPYSSLISTRPALNVATRSPMLLSHHRRTGSQDSSALVNVPAACVGDRSMRSKSESKDPSNLEGANVTKQLVSGVSQVCPSSPSKSLGVDKPNLMQQTQKPTHVFNENTVTSFSSNLVERSEVVKNLSRQSHRSRDDGSAVRGGSLRNYARVASPPNQAIPPERGAGQTENFLYRNENSLVAENKSPAGPLQTQSTKRGLFALGSKKDSAQQDFTLSDTAEELVLPPPEKTKKAVGQKGSNKVDQVFNLIKAKLFEEDPLNLRKRGKKSAPPQSLSESSNTETEEKSRERREEGVDSLLERRNVLKPSDIENKMEICRDTSVHVSSPTTDDSRNKIQAKPKDLSPMKRQPMYYNYSATLPTHRRSALSPRTPYSPFQFDREDVENDNVFYSPRFPEKKQNPFRFDPKDISPSSEVQYNDGQRRQYGHLRPFSSCADLKYGLDVGRSFSVSNVHSSRSPGHDRISTSPKSPANGWAEQASTADPTNVSDHTVACNLGEPLSSTPRSNSWNSDHSSRSPITGRSWSTGSPETSRFKWDVDTLPAPSPSPPMSHSPRRLSRALSSSSTSSRTSEDSPSPRGHRPSSSFIAVLPSFQESSSETTTDDEYDLGTDGEETEL